MKLSFLLFCGLFITTMVLFAIASADKGHKDLDCLVVDDFSGNYEAGRNLLGGDTADDDTLANDTVRTDEDGTKYLKLTPIHHGEGYWYTVLAAGDDCFIAPEGFLELVVRASAGANFSVAIDPRDASCSGWDGTWYSVDIGNDYYANFVNDSWVTVRIPFDAFNVSRCRYHAIQIFNINADSLDIDQIRICSTFGKCPPGKTYCAGQCVNITSDLENCGGCGYTNPDYICDNACIEGQCVSGNDTEPTPSPSPTPTPTPGPDCIDYQCISNCDFIRCAPFGRVVMACPLGTFCSNKGNPKESPCINNLDHVYNCTGVPGV